VQLDLSHHFGGRQTEYPAPVITDLAVLTPNGQPHRRRWEGVIDTGADLSVVPSEIFRELRLTDLRQRVRVWTYRKDEPPRELDIYYLKLGLPSGIVVLTKAIISERSNVLIGRAALLKMCLTINWPANRWGLAEVPIGAAGKE